MADRATVMTAPAPVRSGRTVAAAWVTPLTVRVTAAGVSTVLPAVTIRDSIYVPTQGDDVTTIPLSDGRVLVLGFRS